MRVGGFGTSFLPYLGGLRPPSPVVGAPQPGGVGMPPELIEQMEDYKRWALENKADADREGRRFWALKIPAIVTSASSSAMAYFSAKAVAVVAGAIAAVCVLMDGLHPQGTLRNVHWCAFNDISKLVADMRDQWRVASLETDLADPEKAKREAVEILKKAMKERDRIQEYVNRAETAMAEGPDPVTRRTERRVRRPSTRH